MTSFHTPHDRAINRWLVAAAGGVADDDVNAEEESLATRQRNAPSGWLASQRHTHTGRISTCVHTAAIKPLSRTTHSWLTARPSPARVPVKLTGRTHGARTHGTAPDTRGSTARDCRLTSYDRAAGKLASGMCLRPAAAAAVAVG